MRWDLAFACQVVESWQVAARAAELGDEHTLATHGTARWWRQPCQLREADHAPENPVGISVAVEDTGDMIAETVQALQAAAR